MPENEELLKQLEGTIDQLIEISTFMQRSFSRVFTGDELVNLVEKQKAMQEQMERVKRTCHRFADVFAKEDIARLDVKIERFQKVNQELMEKFQQ